jgi:hypothetical protein
MPGDEWAAGAAPPRRLISQRQPTPLEPSEQVKHEPEVSARARRPLWLWRLAQGVRLSPPTTSSPARYHYETES